MPGEQRDEEGESQKMPHWQERIIRSPSYKSLRLRGLIKVYGATFDENLFEKKYSPRRQ